jgi:deazaflavin-dependent oxidoreductase (nitroreductase family)
MTSLASSLPGAPVLLSDAAADRPRLLRALSAVHAATLALSRGRLYARWYGAPVLLLETVGRRSGRARLAPLVYVPHGEELVVVPANAGADRHPAWWLNLRASGRAAVVVGGRRRPVTARVATGGERRCLWARLARVAPIELYDRRSARHLPVVVLSPLPRYA